MPGVILDYYLPQDSTDSTAVRLSIYKGDQLLRSYSSKKPCTTTWIGGPPKLPTLGNKRLPPFPLGFTSCDSSRVKDVFVLKLCRWGSPSWGVSCCLTMGDQEATTSNYYPIQILKPQPQRINRRPLCCVLRAFKIHTPNGREHAKGAAVATPFNGLADFSQYQSLLTQGGLKRPFKGVGASVNSAPAKNLSGCY